MTLTPPHPDADRMRAGIEALDVDQFLERPLSERGIVGAGGPPIVPGDGYATARERRCEEPGRATDQCEYSRSPRVQPFRAASPFARKQGLGSNHNTAWSRDRSQNAPKL